jgi:hypothetical protein
VRSSPFPEQNQTFSEDEDLMGEVDWAEYKMEKKRRQHYILRRNQVRSNMVIAGVRDLLLHASCDCSLPQFVRSQSQDAFSTLSAIVVREDPWTRVWLPRENEVPSNFECPITKLFMRDPVMTADGHTYDRSAIEKWFADGHSTSPSTGCELGTLLLVPNHQCRKGMEMWREKNAGRNGLKKHVVALCGSVLSARDSDHVHQIVDRIKTLVSGEDVVAKCGPLMSHEEIRRLSAVAASIVCSIGKNRKQTGGAEATETTAVATKRVMTSIHALKNHCESHIADCQRQYQGIQLIESARVVRKERVQKTLGGLTTKFEESNAHLMETEAKLKKVEREYKRLQENMKEAQKQKERADRLMQNEVKSLSRLQSLGHHIETLKNHTKQVLMEVDADPEMIIAPEMQGDTATEQNGAGITDEETMLGKRKFESAVVVAKESCQEDEPRGGKKQRKELKRSSDLTDDELKTAKWLFEEGQKIYWGLEGRGRNTLKGQLMVEVAEKKGDPAARLLCMFFGWNEHQLDQHTARALFEDAKTNGDEKNLSLVFFPIQPELTSKERFESIQIVGAPPLCMHGHTLCASSFSGRGYASGYICDLCDGRSKKGHCGGSRERWHCSVCHFDCCFFCRSKDVGDTVGLETLRGSFDNVADMPRLIDSTAVEVEEVDAVGWTEGADSIVHIPNSYLVDQRNHGRSYSDNSDSDSDSDSNSDSNSDSDFSDEDQDGFY